MATKTTGAPQKGSGVPAKPATAAPTKSVAPTGKVSAVPVKATTPAAAVKQTAQPRVAATGATGATGAARPGVPAAAAAKESTGWMAYIDKQLLGTKCVTQAGIYGLDGSRWACSPGFNAVADEVKKLAAAFKDASDIRAGGIYLNGQKYFALRCDDCSVYGKQGTGGCICVKTAKAVIVGIYDENIQPGQAATAVEKLGDYLKSLNY